MTVGDFCRESLFVRRKSAILTNPNGVIVRIEIFVVNAGVLVAAFNHDSRTSLDNSHFFFANGTNFFDDKSFFFFSHDTSPQIFVAKSFELARLRFRQIIGLETPAPIRADSAGRIHAIFAVELKNILHRNYCKARA